MREQVLLQPVELARVAVVAASEKQASDVVMLDISAVSDFADYFVILTAESSRQMETVSEEIRKQLKLTGGMLHHREGSPHSGWILLDFGDLVVHLFAPEEREFYQMEDAWSRAKEVTRHQ